MDGGSVDDTLAMIDTMNHISSEVATYCIGKAMSGGALTLAAGQKGKRYCLPHAKVMIHQPYGGVYGQTSDVEIQAEEILKTKDELNKMLAEFTGQDVLDIGHAVLEMEREFNVRAGFTESDDELPHFFHSEPLPPFNATARLHSAEVNEALRAARDNKVRASV